MAGIFLNKKRLCSFLSFSSFFFFLLLNNYSAVSAANLATSRERGVVMSASAKSSGLAMGYGISSLSEQAKNLSETFKSDYGLSVETRAKPAQSKKSVFADKQNKETGSTGKTKFFSLAPLYKSFVSSITNIPKQTASVFSSIFSPVGDFVSNLFMNKVPEVADLPSVKKSSSSRSSSSSSSVIPAPRPSEASSEGGQAGIQAVSNKSDNPKRQTSEDGLVSFDEADGFTLVTVKPEITRREVVDLIKQSDDRNLALIRSILTAPSAVANSNSLSVQQSINNLSRRISVMQENNVRQLDHTYNSISRSFDDITSLDGVTMTNSSFSGTTGTFTGAFTGASGTFSGNLTVTGDGNFDSGTLYIDSLNNRVGIASSSPSETLSVNGPTYLSQISAPSVTTDRLYNSSGDLYWNGTIIGSASVGNWTSSGGNVYRSSGNVGIGTTSPGTILSVSGVGNFASTGSTLYSTLTAPYFTATSTTASTFPYASTTALTISGNSYLGTVSSGTWNGSPITVPYGGTGWSVIQSGSIPYGNGSSALSTTTAGTAGYVLAYLNGVPTWTATTTLSDITGTLAVTKGGTGQTSFGQGWLNSDGTTLSASTSPTVAWITATSTTATSTFKNIQVFSLDFATSTNANTYIYWAGTPFITATGSSMFIGLGAGTSTKNAVGLDLWDTAIGYQALQANTTGDGNTALGYRSLYSNTTGLHKFRNIWHSLN